MFVVAFIWLLGCIAVALVVVLVVVAIYGLVKRKPRIVSIAVVACVTISAPFLFALATNELSIRRPPAEKARDVMVLPPEAIVKDVNLFDFSADGAVTFTLPATKPVHEWMKVVWQDNSLGRFSGPMSSLSWEGRSEHQFFSLSYDPASKTYSYYASTD